MSDIKKILLIVLGIFLASGVKAQEYKLKSRFSDENELPSNFINSAICDKFGLFWFTSSGKLMSYDGTQFKRHNYKFTADSSDDNKVDIVYRNVHGEIFFFDNHNHYQILDNQKIVLLKKKYKDAHFSVNISTEDFSNYRALFEYKLGNYQLLNLLKQQKDGYIIREGTIYYFRHKTKILEYIASIKPRNYPSGFTYHGDCLTIFYKLGNLTFRNGQLIKRNTPVSIDGIIVNNPPFFKIFNNNGSNLLWIPREGLYKIIAFGDTIQVKKIIAGSLLPADDDIVSVQLMDGENTLMIACRSTGLYQYTKASFKGYKHNQQVTTSFNSILKLGTDIYTNDGIVWNLEANKAIPSTIRFSNYGSDYIENGSEKYFILDSTIFNITPETINRPIKKGDYLYYSRGCVYKNKVYGWNRNSLFVLENNHMKLLESNLKPTALLTVHSILIHNDTLWVATTNGACAFKLGQKEPVLTDLFKGFSVRSILMDPLNRGIVFFTYGNGTHLYSKGKFYKHSGTNENLDFTHYMFIDNQRRVWLATNKGMYCTDYERWFQSFRHPEKVPYYFQFSKYDGLISNELNGGASHSFLYDSSCQEVYLSTTRGLNTFNPNITSVNFPSQPIRVVETYVDDALTYDLAAIPAHFNTIKFRISSPYYGNKENQLLEYRILNQSNTWRPLNTQNEFYFPRDKAGEQVIQIRYRNGFGEDDYRVVNLNFTVPPLWYESTFNRVIILFLVLGMFWLIMNTRIQIQKRKQIRLKQIIDEQTQNLRTTLDELTLSEDNLRTADTIKEKLIRVLAHDIRSPMISTIYLSNHIKDQLESLPKAELQEPIHLLDNVIVSQTNILNYANDFLAWYNVSNNLVKPNVYDVNIHEVIENILKMYAPIIELNNNKLSYVNDQEIWVQTDANFLSIIIRNLIDNANKNTKAGRIEIQLKESGELRSGKLGQNET
jgi:signal transduction histidine kinase/ligand-binding sensor domain-containing protein